MGKSLDELIKKEKMYHIPTYSRLPVVFVKGEGTNLLDSDGREYLDFIAGLGVVNVGHRHPRVVEAVKKQAEKLIHVTNLFYTYPQLELAQKLAEISFGDKCFFGNSGAEANEGAVKLVRRYAKMNLGENKYKIITAFRSFHGRTLKMIAASGQPEKQKPFQPLPPGFVHVPLNDIEALKKAIDDETCGVMLEAIQGEGGVYPCEISYLKEVRKLCDDKKLLLILDEIQTGVGRTGKMFAYQHFGIEPDILTLAKGLASGFPIGVLIAKEEIAEAFKPGDHGSTFGGGPVVCAAANATLAVVLEESLVEKCSDTGEYLKKQLEELESKMEIVKEVRGLGLMLGIELRKDVAKEAVLKALKEGVIFNNIGTRIIRFLPPLCVTQDEVDKAVGVLENVLLSLEE